VETGENPVQAYPYCVYRFFYIKSGCIILTIFLGGEIWELSYLENYFRYEIFIMHTILMGCVLLFWR